MAEETFNLETLRLEHMQDTQHKYWVSPEISPGLIHGEVPFMESKFDPTYKTMVLSMEYGLYLGEGINIHHGLFHRVV